MIAPSDYCKSYFTFWLYFSGLCFFW